MSRVLWPVNFMAICSGRPARTKVRRAVGQKSWGTRPSRAGRTIRSSEPARAIAADDTRRARPPTRSRRRWLLRSTFPAAGQSRSRSCAERGEPKRVQADFSSQEDEVSEPTCDPVHSRFTGVAFPLTAARTSPRAGLRSWAIAAAAAVIGAVTLGAQAPTTDAAIPLPFRARRQPQLERQAGGSEGGDARSIRVYRWDGPPDVLFRHYLGRLSAVRDTALDTASLASLRPDETTPVSYHLAFHSFEDQCADSAAGAAAGREAPAACKVWRRGKNKRRALGGRIGLEPGGWIERATFTWFSRGTEGDLVRWRVELYDSGLSDNWQHWMPGTQLTIERMLLKR